MRLPISACLIVKNDAARLERAVASVRPYVDEICIVDTGSTDGTAEIAERLADRFERFTACNFDDGDIADFSAARNRSFELASHDTVLWLDSDDVVEGGAEIADAIAWCHGRSKGQPWRAMFGYAYDHDEGGRCISWQQRERIVYPKSKFHWVYRVHEGLTCVQPTEWQTLEPPQRIVWKHDLDRRKPRSRRNLRILRDYVQRVGVDNVDSKTQFDLGIEFAKAGDHMLAIAWLTRFVQSSDLDDERVLACMQLVEVLSFWPGREQDAEVWAQKAIEIRPDWAEGYWAIAKMAYAAAAKRTDSERRHLERAAHFVRKGLEKTPTVTRVAINPRDRAGDMQAMLFEIETRLGRYDQALDAARACLAARPDDVSVKLHVSEAERRANRAAKSTDIVIMCGVTNEAWDPDTARQFGIGGSETAVIEMAKRLAASGARVRVFCRCFTAGLYDGVEYRPMNESDQASGCDLLIAWRNATLLEATPARVKWLWLHDTDPHGANDWNLSLADRILVLSQWHAAHIAKQYPDHASRIEVTRNGIDLTRFDQTIERNPHKAIYSSSPDRGLDQLLAMWPRIREQVPDAELHVFYGMQAFPLEYQRMMAEKIAATPGAFLRGRVNQETLAKEMLSAGVWLHPSWADGRPFCETSCIGAMEATAAGLRIVCSGWGALPETARYGVLVHGDAIATDYQDHFVESAVVALTQAADLWRPAIQGHARDAFSWDGVSKQWGPLMQADLADKPSLPVVRAARDGRIAIDLILAPNASGNVPMDARNAGGEAQGGGSRVGFLGLVQAMADRGDYRVRAFSTFIEPHVHNDGVDYCRLDLLRSMSKPDVVLAYYDTSPLAEYGHDVLRIASHHTYAPYMFFDFADVNTAPSEAAMRFLQDRFDPTGTWRVLPNAVGELSIQRRPVPGRIIYHTSPDRGLHLLLQAYPEIKRAVPHASLHVVGPVQQTVDGKNMLGKSGEQQRALRASLRTAQAVGGVHLLGRLPRVDLWRELEEASVFAFPCSPTAPCETFSISIMESLKIGLPVVLSPADSLESIYAGHVRMTPAPAAEHVDEFTEAVVDVLTSESERNRLAATGKDLARQYTFERAASTLDEIVRTHRQRHDAALMRPRHKHTVEGEALSAYL